MKKYSKKIALLMVMVLLIGIPYQSISATSYKTYFNDRFGFSMKYPTFFKQSKEPVNGSGVTMTGKNATLSMYGEYAVVYSNGKEMQKTLKEWGRKMSAVKATTNSLYYESKNGKKITFYYSYFVSGGIISMELTCKTSEKSKYKKIANTMMKSIRKNKTFY